MAHAALVHNGGGSTMLCSGGLLLEVMISSTAEEKIAQTQENVLAQFRGSR